MPRKHTAQTPSPPQDTHRRDTRARVAAQDVNRKQREAMVLSLRVEGHSFAQIAAMVGYSDQSGAHKAWRRALSAIPRQAAEDQREFLRMQLEEASKVMLAKTKRGDSRAAMALVQIHDRYSKMLNLDIAPETTAGAQMALIPIAVDVLEAV